MLICDEVRKFLLDTFSIEVPQSSIQEIAKNSSQYFENNKGRMKYNEYRAKGYPIGSGCIEGACRYLVKDRMEMTGMRWKVNGAQAVLSLRSIYINNYLNDYWDYFMTGEMKRI